MEPLPCHGSLGGCLREGGRGGWTTQALPVPLAAQGTALAVPKARPCRVTPRVTRRGDPSVSPEQGEAELHTTEGQHIFIAFWGGFS